MKKYEFTSETINFCGRELHRIKALIDFGNVKAGDLGGYIEKEENLSHEGNAWVCDAAKVYDEARVYGEAKVYGKAKVYGEAKVYDAARVYRETEIRDTARVCINADIKSFRDVFYSFGLGKEEHGTTFFRTKSGEIAVKSGCFFGSTLKEFEGRVKGSRKGIIEREYLLHLETAKAHFGVEEVKESYDKSRTITESQI